MIVLVEITFLSFGFMFPVGQLVITQVINIATGTTAKERASRHKKLAKTDNNLMNHDKILIDGMIGWSHSHVAV